MALVFPALSCCMAWRTFFASATVNVSSASTGFVGFIATRPFSAVTSIRSPSAKASASKTFFGMTTWRLWPMRLTALVGAVLSAWIVLLGLWPLGVVLVFELLSGFHAIECPIDRDAISVGSPVPGAGFRPENPDLAESALPQTLLGKEADLQFRLIQPTSVYRRVVNGEPIPQRPTLFLAEAVRQRLLGVGTQVVHDQMDGLRRGIAVGDGLDEVCKFQRRPGRGDLRKVNPCLRFDAAEYIGSSSTFVFIVALGHAARFHGQGFSDIVVKSHRLFIYAHHRLFGRQRPFIDFQHIFHRLDVFVIELGDAPHFFPATAEGRVLATRSELSRVLPWGPVCV